MRATNLDDFMQRRLGKPADVYLQNGVKLSGVLLGHDNDAVFLRADGDLAATQMILWSAISTVVSRGRDPIQST